MKMKMKISVVDDLISINVLDDQDGVVVVVVVDDFDVVGQTRSPLGAGAKFPPSGIGDGECDPWPRPTPLPLLF
ncbi:hypothetical protein CsSME_00014644 [Camellia sinensis var. sinensis]